MTSYQICIINKNVISYLKLENISICGIGILKVAPAGWRFLVCSLDPSETRTFQMDFGENKQNL